MILFGDLPRKVLKSRLYYGEKQKIIIEIAFGYWLVIGSTCSDLGSIDFV